VLSVCEDWAMTLRGLLGPAKKKCVEIKFFACLRKKYIFINLFTDIRIENKKYIYFFFSYEFLLMPELELFVVEFLPTPELKLFVVEFLPTPELKLFVVEFLIGIIRVRIFTNARVGSIRD
jgi:hypothetical protein